MNNQLLKETIIKHKKTISYILIILLLSVSLFTMGYVVYRFFFWEPIVIDPLIINWSNITLSS